MDDKVTTKFLNGLIELIHSKIQEATPDPITNTVTGTSGGNHHGTTTLSTVSQLDQPRRHFERTLEYIASREYEGVVITSSKGASTSTSALN